MFWFLLFNRKALTEVTVQSPLHARVIFLCLRKTDRRVVNSCEASSRFDQFKYFRKVKTQGKNY